MTRMCEHPRCATVAEATVWMRINLPEARRTPFALCRPCLAAVQAGMGSAICEELGPVRGDAPWTWATDDRIAARTGGDADA